MASYVLIQIKKMSENDNIDRVQLAFDCMGAVIKTTKSKTVSLPVFL
jgi:hypothetical protein